MVKSMTGYGRAEQSLNGRTITVELRSVNNRYLDCSIRIPRLYLFAEDQSAGGGRILRCPAGVGPELWAVR